MKKSNHIEKDEQQRTRLSNISHYIVYIILFIPLIVTHSTFFPYIVGKNVIFRICVGALALISGYIIWKEKDKKFNHTAVVVSFAIFTISLLISAFSGVNTSKSIFSNLERMEGWITIAGLFILLVALLQTYKTQKEWFTLIYVQLLVSLLVTIFTLFEYKEGVRLAGNFGNPAYAGIYGLFNMWFALLGIGYGLRDKILQKPFTNKETDLSTYNYNKYVLPLSALVFSLNGFIVYLSQTRSVILGFILGLCVSLTLFALSSDVSKAIRKISIGFVMFIVVSVSMFWVFRESDFVQDSPTLSRVANISLNDQTTRSRTILWEIGVESVKERPLFGWGQENFIYAFSKHYDPRMWDQEEWFDRAHNVFFDWLTQGGIVGLIAYISIFVTSLVSLFSKKTKENVYVLSPIERSLLTGLLVSYFVNNIFVFDNITSYILFVIVLAYSAFRSDKTTLSLNPVTRPVAAVVYVVVGAVIIWSGFSALKGSQYIIDAFSALNTRDVKSAITYFEKATTYPASRQEAVEQYMLNISQSNEVDIYDASYYKGIVNSYNRIIAIDSENPRLRMIGASVFSILGNKDQALIEAQKASSLMPNKQSAQLLYARILIEKNNISHAQDIIQNILNVTPEHRQAKALDIVIKSLKLDPSVWTIINNETNDDVLADPSLVSILESYRRFDVLKVIARKRISLHPGNPQLYVNKAILYYKEGQKEESIKQFKDIQIQFPELHSNIEEIISTIK